MESFTYNLQNQLTGYQSSNKKASYAYGADGLRKSKTVNNVMMKYVWDRGNLAAEVSGSTIVNMYYYGPDGITSRETSNGDKTLYLKNAHGDVVGMSDTSGNVSANYQYDAFGNTMSETSPDPFGYCGEYLDSESGLIYLRNRYYDSSTGRFITEDPAKDGVNWYSYCAGNPVTFVDPWGLETVRVSMEGITYHQLDNVEDKASGTYASIRSIARHNNATVDFRLDEDGVGATVNYTIADNSIGGTYGHRIEIRFNNFQEGEFASSVRIFAFGDNGEFEVTDWASDPVAQKLNTQEAYFYVKKDENSDNLVVQAKVSTMYYCSGNKRMLDYMLGMWNLSGIISERENIDRQMVLDKLYESQPLLKFDPSVFVDMPSSNYEAFVETAMNTWIHIEGY